MATELGGRWSGHTGRWRARYRALESPPDLSLLLLSTLTLTLCSQKKILWVDVMRKVHRTIIIITLRVGTGRSSGSSGISRDFAQEQRIGRRLYGLRRFIVTPPEQGANSDDLHPPLLCRFLCRPSPPHSRLLRDLRERR